jgi:hypothetical protein
MKSPLPYNQLYAVSLAVFVFTLIVGAIQIADPLTLGFSPLAARWVGVVASVLGGIASILPRITKPPASEREGLD